MKYLLFAPCLTLALSSCAGHSFKDSSNETTAEPQDKCVYLDSTETADVFDCVFADGTQCLVWRTGDDIESVDCQNLTWPRPEAEPEPEPCQWDGWRRRCN